MTRSAFAGLVLAGAILCACASSPGGAPAGYDPEAIDPAIYDRADDPNDPYRAEYARFRARRERDMASPDSPRPLPRYPNRHRARDRSWAPIESSLAFDWEAIRGEAPAAAEALTQAFRIRRAFDHPDLEILELMLGAGGVLPAHADGAPGAYVVVSGRGEIEVDGERWRVTPGTTAKLEPYSARRVVAKGGEPLRWLWIRWAPGGDQAYVDAGYYLTGANQHVQPAQADFAPGYLFWGDASTEHGPVTNAGSGRGAARDPASAAHAAARAAAGGPLYPDVPVFGHEITRSWLSAETVKSGGFFFSKDLGSLEAVGDRMIQIARHKAIFRASRPDGDWDFNFSQSGWGPRSTYVEHSHVIPEFYYVLSGPVIYGVDGERYESLPGDILFNNSYAPHLAQGIADGLVFRSFSSTFAPNGDRSVFDRPAFLLEALPEQPASAALPDDVAFH